MKRYARPLTHASILLAALFLAACATAPSRAPGPDGAPYLVLVSFDGFRWDYASLTDTPNMDRMASEGLTAEALQPAFPTITFPNHYSIATGFLPYRHGIVANDFPDGPGGRWYRYKDRSTVQDGSFYLAEPVWVTAEKAGLRTAAFYFVGTEADVGGFRPAYWRSFDADVPGEARVRQVLDWLAEPAEKRPRFLTLYFELVDDHGHWYGPESAENLAAIRRLDSHLGELLDGIGKLPHCGEVSVVLVSDHGQAYYDDREPFVMDRWVDLDGTRVVGGGPYVFVYFDDANPSRAAGMRDTLNHSWDCGRAYLPGELPAHWRAGASDRYPGLFVQADAGCGVIASEAWRHKISAGDHGWTPDVADMNGILYATGPRIPAGERVGKVHVTDVYPLLIDILGLEAPDPVDGDPAALASRLLPETE